MHKSEENYLKMIYELTIERNQKMVRNNELAEAFSYTDQSVNEMIKKLSQKKLVTFEPYKGVYLTKLGQKEAVRMIRTHRIWEVFLQKHLGYAWHDVHLDAEDLEHASSPELIEKLYQYLGNPTYCQHGNPIPSLEGVMHPVPTRSLADAKVGSIFIVARVIDRKELLKYLDEQDITLGMQFEVLDKNQVTGHIRLKAPNGEKQVTLTAAGMIFDH